MLDSLGLKGASESSHIYTFSFKLLKDSKCEIEWVCQLPPQSLRMELPRGVHFVRQRRTVGRVPTARLRYFYAHLTSALQRVGSWRKQSAAWDHVVPPHQPDAVLCLWRLWWRAQPWEMGCFGVNRRNNSCFDLLHDKEASVFRWPF